MFENRFKDQVAVVTGGASGIGYAIGARIAAEGGRVLLWDVQREPLEKAVAGLKAQGCDVTSALVDVSDEGAVQAGMTQAFEQHGRLDIAVNSAGIPGITNRRITDFPVEEFDRVIRVNLRGTFLVTKYATTQMLKRNYGRVLLLASMAGKEGNPNMAGYTAAKAGVIGLVKGIGKEFAETGITVNGLAPAVIRTPMNENTAPEQLKYLTDRIPMRRLGTVDEVAALACWILSGEASFNTGFVFDLSGGRATY